MKLRLPRTQPGWGIYFSGDFDCASLHRQDPKTCQPEESSKSQEFKTKSPRVQDLGDLRNQERRVVVHVNAVDMKRWRRGRGGIMLLIFLAAIWTQKETGMLFGGSLEALWRLFLHFDFA